VVAGASQITATSPHGTKRNQGAQLFFRMREASASAATSSCLDGSHGCVLCEAEDILYPTPKNIAPWRSRGGAQVLIARLPLGKNNGQEPVTDGQGCEGALSI